MRGEPGAVDVVYDEGLGFSYDDGDGVARRWPPSRRVFVAMICDRHTDPEPEVFTTADAALGYARTWALEHATDPGDVVEEPVDGRLYHARYSTEDDAVWVVEKTVDAP